jgi:FlaG/FlaF family flagellin (archaellin)
VDESEADLVITGTIQSIRQTAANVGKGEIVNEYKVTVTVKAKCENSKTSKALFDKTFSNYGTMEGTGSPDAYKEAILNALEQNTNDILNATLAAW